MHHLHMVSSQQIQCEQLAMFTCPFTRYARLATYEGPSQGHTRTRGHSEVHCTYLAIDDEAEQVLGSIAAPTRRVLPLPEPCLDLMRERRQSLRQEPGQQITAHFLGLISSGSRPTRPGPASESTYRCDQSKSPRTTGLTTGAHSRYCIKRQKPFINLTRHNRHRPAQRTAALHPSIAETTQLQHQSR